MEGEILSGEAIIGGHQQHCSFGPPAQAGRWTNAAGSAEGQQGGADAPLGEALGLERRKLWGDLSAAFHCLWGGHQEEVTAVQQEYVGSRCRELDTAFSNLVLELALSRRTPEIPPNLNLPGFLWLIKFSLKSHYLSPPPQYQSHYFHHLTNTFSLQSPVKVLYI